MKESRYNIWVETESSAYVFNGLSGALLAVSLEDRQAVRDFVTGVDGSSNYPAETLQRLVLGRMLVQDDGDELALLAQRYQFSRNDATNFALTMITSLGCNFDCPYCFEAKHPSIMVSDVEEAVLTVLDDQLPKIRTFSVSWFGGEPLVGKKPLLALSDAFIERCDRASVAYTASMTTNGYLLDEETCRQLRDRRIRNVQVCLDGPPEIHDRMRPLLGGQGTFWRIVNNLRHAVDYLGISVRVNVDTENFGHAEELLRILATEGLGGKLTVYPGQLVGVADGVPSPSSTYTPRCFTNREFARAERDFVEMAARMGFSKLSVPRPVGAPCTAVRKNELVVGSNGELYKCWESVGNHLEVIGHIRDYRNPNGRLQKWLKYEPFENDECRGCIALPVCMGGCAHHAMDLLQYENRCGTFRHNYRERVLAYVKAVESGGPFEAPSLSAAGQPRMETR